MKCVELKNSSGELAIYDLLMVYIGLHFEISLQFLDLVTLIFRNLPYFNQFRMVYIGLHFTNFHAFYSNFAVKLHFSA